MMLIVGGAGQGKLSFALRRSGLDASQVTEDPRAGKPIVTGLADWMRGEADPLPVLEALILERPDVILLCDEVGCGVVPMDPEDRAWRERVGRTCCALAERADCVIRLYCGIPSILKGEPEWN